MDNNKVFFDRKKVIKFLAEKEKASVESCARVVMINQEAEELKKEVEEVDKKLRALL